MRNTLLKLHESEPRKLVDISRYTISFGSENAPNKIDIFYGIECGFSREFLQNDFKILLENFTLTGKTIIRLHPASLDATTIAFAEMIYMLPPQTKRQTFMQLCHNDTDRKKLLLKLSTKPSESTFFDVVKILSEHPEISETLMIKVNGTLLNDLPSLHALEQASQ
ncbi:MAG: hypothetical protein Q8Q56_00890 [Alphaproteobacteria bacterium]|nr:hypothetical protein [Alphaproteobacteria bacterium]